MSVKLKTYVCEYWTGDLGAMKISQKGSFTRMCTSKEAFKDYAIEEIQSKIFERCEVSYIIREQNWIDRFKSWIGGFL